MPGNLDQLLDRIQGDILNPSAPLSSILLSAKVLAFQLKNPELTSWVKSELDGYQSRDEVPDYRIISCHLTGTYTNGVHYIQNRSVPISNLPEWLKDIAKNTRVVDGIRTVEEHANSESLGGKWPADWVNVWNTQNMANDLDYGFMDITQGVSPTSFAQILDTVRSRLLDFILAISDRPWVGAQQPPPRDEVKQLVQVTILNQAQGESMSLFDQRGQNVDTQYNAAGDINISSVRNSLEFVQQLERINGEIERAATAKIIDPEVAVDTAAQVKKAIIEAGKEQPSKTRLSEYFGKAKDLLGDATAAAGLVKAIVDASEATQRLFT